MPNTGIGWELLIVRKSVQERMSTDKNGRKRKCRRTIGTSSLFHDGKAVTGMTGFTAEAKGPGNNFRENNGKRIEAKRSRSRCRTA